MTDKPNDPWSGYTPYRYDPDAPAVEGERVPLFYMGDKCYTAPKRIGVAAGLQAIENAALKGIPFATYQLVLDCIGPEAFQVLSEAKMVPYEEAQEMISRLGKLYFGQAMDLAGK